MDLKSSFVSVSWKKSSVQNRMFTECVNGCMFQIKSNFIFRLIYIHDEIYILGKRKEKKLNNL